MAFRGPAAWPSLLSAQTYSIDSGIKNYAQSGDVYTDSNHSSPVRIDNYTTIFLNGEALQFDGYFTPASAYTKASRWERTAPPARFTATFGYSGHANSDFLDNAFQAGVRVAF